jgi:C-8 sterol isomerase
MRLLTLLGVLIGGLASLMYMLEAHLDKFYVFTPAELHALSLEAIEKHGNDTASVAAHIVSSLSHSHPKYVNLDEEWVFVCIILQTRIILSLG